MGRPTGWGLGLAPLALGLWALAAACGDDPKPEAEPTQDAGDDTSDDAAQDVTPDADAEPDVLPDVAPDAQPDVLPDVEPDAQPDADVEQDVEMDAEQDGPTPTDLPDEPDVDPDVILVEPECSPDDPCRAGVCFAGACVDAAPCFGDLECLGGDDGSRVCAGCFEGDCEAGGACRVACQGSAQCGPGEACVDGGCAPARPLECASDQDCLGAQECDAQAFVCRSGPTCREDVDCQDGQRCDADLGQCVGCRSNTDCDGLQTCQRAMFSASCVEPSRCASNLDCQGLRFCDTFTGRCADPLCEPDRLEPNNRVNEQVGFVTEGVTTGLGLCGGEVDLFLVAAEPGLPVRVTVRAEGGAVQLYAYPGGTDPFDPQDPAPPIAASSGTREVQGLLLPAVEGSAAYLLHVGTPGDGVIEYELDVAFDVPEGVEQACGPDEDAGQGGASVPLEPNAPFVGELCALDGQEPDSDWLRVDLPATFEASVGLLYDPTGDPVEVRVWRQDVGALTELEGAVMPEATGAVVTLPLRNALTSYYIELAGTQPGGKVRYSASLALFEDVVCLDDLDPNDAPADATPLEVDPQTGTLRLEGLEACGEDLDHYLIAAPPNKGLRVRIEREVGSPGLVPALALLQEQGDGTFASVGTSRTRVASAQVLLGNTTVQGGRYVVAVLPPGGLVSRYTLEVELVEPFCERNDEYEPSSDAQPASLLFSPAEPYLCPGEVDVYEVLARAGESLEVSVSGLPSALLDVRRADGASLAEGVSGTFRQTLAQGGPIRIRVRSSNMAAQGAYSLRSSAVVGPPSNDACAGAAPLEVGQEVRGRISQANDDAAPTGCFVLDGSPDVVYALEVEQAQRLALLVEQVESPGFDGVLAPVLFVRSACADGATELPGLCGGDFGDIEPGDGAVTFEGFFAPGTWYVWVDGAVDGALGDFVLRVEPR